MSPAHSRWCRLPRIGIGAPGAFFPPGTPATPPDKRVTHPAVRRVEVSEPVSGRELVEMAFLRFLSARVLGSPSTLPRSAQTRRLHPRLQTGARVASTSVAFCLRDSWSIRSPLRSALGGGYPSLLWPLLTSRSACAWPFQAQSEISPGKNTTLAHITAGSTLSGFRTIGASRFLARSPPRPGLVSGSCSSARGFATRFLPTLGHPCAVAVRFDRDGLLSAGLAPAGLRPCWTH
jgi:hypothetical protein